ncbi:hypothetical protein SAMN05444695_104277 [Rhodococcus triatomae]|uniref:SPOR domain-containing protein n=1 Tax=Rhodococcus triatomae TaxID=300028 RepID=A0A1G8H1M5_9NOCA|nr:hypothetical protein [Rhodococcus triatomae]SDI00410.1 hypothetical protein SAMN05444695_104277 [Rhodococcus triatomae]
MSDWYYEVSTGRVTRGKVPGVFDRMGPYPSEEAARDALALVRERNEAADEAEREQA